MTSSAPIPEGSVSDYIERALAAPRDGRLAKATAEILFAKYDKETNEGAQASLLDKALSFSPYNGRLWLRAGLDSLQSGEASTVLLELATAAVVSREKVVPTGVLAAALLFGSRTGPSAESARWVADRLWTQLPNANERDRRAILWLCIVTEASAKQTRIDRIAQHTAELVEQLSPTPQDAVWATSITCAAGLAYSTHRKSTPQARERRLMDLSRIIHRWNRRLPESGVVPAAAAFLAVLRAPLDDLGSQLSTHRTVLADNRLVRLLVSVRVTGLDIPGDPFAELDERMNLLDRLGSTNRRSVGVDRELFDLLDRKGRLAISCRRYADADEAWRRGLAEDESAIGFTHNLAMIALAARNAAAFLERSRQWALDLYHWVIRSNEPARPLEALKRRYALFAGRLGRLLQKETFKDQRDVARLLSLWHIEVTGWLACLRAQRLSASALADVDLRPLFAHAANPTIRSPLDAWPRPVWRLLESTEEPADQLLPLAMLGLAPGATPQQIAERAEAMGEKAEGCRWLRDDDERRILVDRIRNAPQGLEPSMVQDSPDVRRQWAELRIRVGQAQFGVSALGILLQQLGTDSEPDAWRFYMQMHQLLPKCTDAELELAQVVWSQRVLQFSPGFKDEEIPEPLAMRRAMALVPDNTLRIDSPKKLKKVIEKVPMEARAIPRLAYLHAVMLNNDFQAAFEDMIKATGGRVRPYQLSNLVRIARQGREDVSGLRRRARELAKVDIEQEVFEQMDDVEKLFTEFLDKVSP